MTLAAIWAAVSDFFSYMFQSVADVLEGIAGEPILLVMGIVLPVAGIVYGWVRRLLRRRG